MPSRDRLASMTLVLLLTACPAAPSVAEENWPHWRGPRRDGTSLATGLPTAWSATEGVRWRLPLPGAGPSTPVIWGDHIFLTSAEGSDLVLLAVRRSSGELLWKRKLDDGNRDVLSGESNLAAPSPVTDGKHVWVLLGTGLLACYDFAGSEIWRVEIQERYERFDLNFGISSSPLLDGDRLYLQFLHTGQQLVLAVDKRTGKEVWKHLRTTDARAECLHSYASPVLYRSGERAILLIHGADYLTGHSLDDGRELWRIGGLQDPESYNPTLRLVATPVVADDLIVVPSAKNGPVLGLRPAGASGNLTGSNRFVVWRLDRGTPDVPSPVVHDGLVYLSGESGKLTSVDARTGKIVYREWPHRSRHRGSPLAADGKIYLFGADGTVTVIKAGRKYELLAQNRIEERLAASPAVADGVLYLRTYEALYAIGGASTRGARSGRP